MGNMHEKYTPNWADLTKQWNPNQASMSILKISKQRGTPTIVFFRSNHLPPRSSLSTPNLYRRGQRTWFLPTKWSFLSPLCESYRKLRCIRSNLFTTTFGGINPERKYTRRLENTLFKRVTLPPFIDIVLSKTPISSQISLQLVPIWF